MAASQSPNVFIPEEWSDTVESIVRSSTSSLPPITFICGPKKQRQNYLLSLSSQQFTSQRICTRLRGSRIANIFDSPLVEFGSFNFVVGYKRIAYLDADVGQPEFTPPGCLSLTIVNEATPDLMIPCVKTPERSYFFGDVSSKRDPQTYLHCVTALWDYYTKVLCFSSKNGRSSISELPLIVNTPGWVKGIGYDLLVDMLKCIGPTHVVKINISSRSKNLPAGAFWLEDDDDASVNLIEISSAHKDSCNRSVLVQKEARLILELRLIAYFRQCFPSDKNVTTIKELAHALACHPPYQVPMSSIKIRHLHCKIPNTDVLYSLNATIVGLAVNPEDLQSLPVCVGLGIVRGIDVSRNLLYVITPVPQSVLESVDVLLQGFIQIPNGPLQVQGCVSPYMSANVIPSN